MKPFIPQKPSDGEHENMAIQDANQGKARTYLLLWLLGIPLPILLLILLFRGC